MCADRTQSKPKYNFDSDSSETSNLPESFLLGAEKNKRN